MWMQGGQSFTKRDGTDTGVEAQDIEPCDIGQAHAHGWTPAPDPTEPDEDYRPDLGNAAAGI